MDGNKDEALKCLQIGKQALESGDKSRALKFLSKARRLDPSLPISDLLSSAEDQSPNSIPSPPTESSSTTTSTTSTTAATSRTCTEEQLTIVTQIKNQKDYYKILGLEKSCTVDDVRKAYRKLSLKVHPDKNKAPGAEDAFKLVSKAFQCLSDEESKNRYDIVGPEEDSSNYRRAATTTRRHRNGFNGFYEEDLDPEEIFRNFFFGGNGPQAATPFGTFHFRTGGMGTAQQPSPSGNFNLRALIQMLPIILLLLLNFLPSSDPVYSLSRAQGYEYKMETGKGVAYFVKSGAKFEEEYPYGSEGRAAMEGRIERDYVGVLSQNCQVELQRRQWGLVNKVPHCDMLQKFRQQGEVN